MRRRTAAVCAALAAFAALAFFAHRQSYFWWDLQLARALQSFSPRWMFWLMRGVSVFADDWVPYALVPATVLALIAAGHRREAAALLLSAAGAGALDTVGKLVVGRPRPPHQLVAVFKALESHSFPSGHVSFYVCYFGFIFYLAWTLVRSPMALRRLALMLSAIPVALVGLSRVYLGEHWPSDVIGGYLLGGLW